MANRPNKPAPLAPPRNAPPLPPQPRPPAPPLACDQTLYALNPEERSLVDTYNAQANLAKAQAEATLQLICKQQKIEGDVEYRDGKLLRKNLALKN